MLSAQVGMPMWVRTLVMYSWEMEGKADEKSMRIQAPSLCMREVCMEGCRRRRGFVIWNVL